MGNMTRARVGGSWTQALELILKNPSAPEHASDVVTKTKDIIVIKDKFPKSKHHFLVLPFIDIEGPAQIKKEHIPLLQDMKSIAQQVIADVKKTDKEPLTWKMGFHAIPSMKHLHMHVITLDYSSLNLKSKKHWNSFNTKYFIPTDDFIASIQDKGSFQIDALEYHKILDQDPECPNCRAVFRQIPKMKHHIGICSFYRK